jgi:hypothetical protein
MWVPETLPYNTARHTRGFYKANMSPHNDSLLPRFTGCPNTPNLVVRDTAPTGSATAYYITKPISRPHLDTTKGALAVADWAMHATPQNA